MGWLHSSLMSKPEPREAELRRVRECRVEASEPSDFREFWTQTLTDLLLVDPKPRPCSLPETDALALGELSCCEVDSWGGAKIKLWFSADKRPADSEGVRPLLVTSHGYGGSMDPERVRRLSTLGFDVVAVDARGFGLSRDALEAISPDGYLLTGADTKEDCILRGAVCDFLQAYRAGQRFFGASAPVVFQGFSFAGGLCTMAAGVLGLGSVAGLKGMPALPHLLAPGVPTFGDLDRRIVMCEEGSGRELADYLRANPSKREQVLSVFRYFDAAYFAPHVSDESASLQIIAGVGIYDPVVPAETVFPVLAGFRAPVKLFEMPCSHTELEEEREWVRWESAWIKAGRKLAALPVAQLSNDTAQLRP